MLRICFIWLVLLLPTSVFAQSEQGPSGPIDEPAPAAEIPSTKALEDIAPVVRPQVANRTSKTVTLGGVYGVYSFLVPSHFGKGFTVGADWLEVAVPIGKAYVSAPIVEEIQDENSKKNTRKVLDYLCNLPTINVVKASLGYSI